ncbi:MAG: pilus assembly protein TadG-related protein [Planctomycetota bacterium JB042]
MSPNLMLLRRRTFRSLLSSEESSAAFGPATVSFARRLHRGQRGNITILFLGMILAFYVAAAAAWNQGLAVSYRVKHQAAADAAAYAAANWMARCMNNCVGANVLINRHVAAHAVAASHLPAWGKVPINWADKIKDLAGVPFVGPALAAAMAAYIAAVEVPPWLAWMGAGWLPAIADSLAIVPLPFFGPFGPRITELVDYQRAWVDATPKAIEETRKQLENYYDVKIRYTWPGASASSEDAKKGYVRPPLKRANLVDALLTYIMVANFRLPDDKKDFPQDNKFSIISVGKAKSEWNSSTGGMFSATALMHAILGTKPHVLQTHNVLEFGLPTGNSASDLNKRKHFSVVATVEGKGPAKSPGLLGTPLAATKIFDQYFAPKNKLMAYSQAEVHHPADGTPLGFIPLPFRMFSLGGWQWQPRLTEADQLRNALTVDKELQKWFKNISVKQNNYNSLQHISLH